MEKLTGPIKRLNLLKKDLISNELDVNLFYEAGVFVVRGLLLDVVKNKYMDLFKNHSQYKTVKRNKFNPVEVRTNDQSLRKLACEPLLLKCVKKILGDHIGLYNFRFVVKDGDNKGPVFLHNDLSYHCGYLNRISAFVALTNAGKDNGGLTFWLGTNHFGMLGDAGEINPDILQDHWPTLTPEILPGDVVFMHSATWHASGPNLSGADRILSDIHYQPANDPTSLELLTGDWQTEYRFPQSISSSLFKRSRVSRLKELEKINNYLDK